jgi:hypothetical protein
MKAANFRQLPDRTERRWLNRSWFRCIHFQRSVQTPAVIVIHVAQFIVVCSRVKTYEIGENLLSVSAPISGPQEVLIDADSLIPAPALQH